MLKTLYRDGQYEKYVQLCQDNVAFAIDRIGNDSMSAVVALQDLGDGLLTLGDLTQALSCYERLTTSVKARHGTDNPGYMSGLAFIARTLTMLRCPRQADVLVTEAVRIFDRVQNESVDQFASAMTHVAVVLQMRGRTDEAEEVLLNLVARAGSGSTSIATALLALARLYRSKGSVNEAAHFVERTIQLQVDARKTFCRQHGDAWSFLGDLHRDAGQIERAMQCLEEAAAAYRNAYPQESERLRKCTEQIRQLQELTNG